MALLTRNRAVDTPDTAIGTDSAVPVAAPALPVAIVRVNLLPPELLEARELRKVKFGVAGAAAVVAVLVGVYWYSQQGSLGNARSERDAAQATNTQLAQTVARLGSVDELFAQVDRAKAMVHAATATEVHWSRYLDDLAIQLPDHVWLTQISFTETPGATTGATTGATGTPTANGTPTATGSATATPLGTATVLGQAYVHDDVANLLERLTKLKGLSNVYLSNSTESVVGSSSRVPVVSWTATAVLTTDALANPNGRGAE
jgi:Tfp pilus assembly protein PilN